MQQSSDEAGMRPIPFRSPLPLEPRPRFHPLALAASPLVVPSLFANEPIPDATRAATARPLAPVAELPRRVTQPSVPGQIVLDLKQRLSLPQLFWLEQELTSIPGLEHARVSIKADGAVAVEVPPTLETQAREFLELSGQLSQGIPSYG